MKKDIAILAVVGLFIFSFGVGSFAGDLVWQDIGRGNLNLKTILVNPQDQRMIYIGTNSGVSKTDDGGETWRNILFVKGQNRAVNFLLFDPKDKNSLYAATGGGLFYSANQGKSWAKIFQGKNYLENECTVSAVLPQAIYLGTKGGLFISKDRGRSWHKESGELANSHILAIAYDIKEPNYIYVACVDGVFKTKDQGQSWERIFVVNPTDNNNVQEDAEDEDQDGEDKVSNIRYISLDPNNLNYLYLATSRGIYKSQDRGLTWEAVSNYGLLNRDTRFLLISGRSNLYTVTKSGVFEYGNDRWQELSLRLLAQDISFLVKDDQNNLYAATDKGLFKARQSELFFGIQKFEGYFKNEPGIKELHEAAIKYAQVIDPKKIENLRKQARIKAILPEVALDYDRTVTSYSNTTTTRFTVGPADWGVSFKWSLSDLIWSEQQRLIDSQVRLMVQLRDDILDEVTKLYFERLRVKMELDNLSIEDRKKRFEKELRLQELTAMLDALTGGYFSQQIKDKS